MSILKYELKQYRTSLIIWIVSLSLCIIFGCQLFATMILSAGNLSPELLATNKLVEAMGIDMMSFFSAVGMYSYLNSFILFAAAVQALNIGLSIISKEHMQNTADFLMTKPYSRGYIFMSKYLAAFLSILITSIVYIIASFIALELTANDEYNFLPFFLIAFTFFIVQFIFLNIGILVAVILSRISNIILLSFGITFISYAFGMFAMVVKSAFARALSPFKYVDTKYVMANNSYELSYMVLYIILAFGSIALAYIIFNRKDFNMVS